MKMNISGPLGLLFFVIFLQTELSQSSALASKGMPEVPFLGGMPENDRETEYTGNGWPEAEDVELDPSESQSEDEEAAEGMTRQRRIPYHMPGFWYNFLPKPDSRTPAEIRGKRIPYHMPGFWYSFLPKPAMQVQQSDEEQIEIKRRSDKGEGRPMGVKGSGWINSNKMNPQLQSLQKINQFLDEAHEYFHTLRQSNN